VVLLIMVLHSS